MLGHRLFVRHQPMLLSSMTMMMIIIASIVLVVTNVGADDCKPEIITYGICPIGVGTRFQYEIQRPLAVERSDEMRSSETPGFIRRAYCYGIDGTSKSDSRWSNVGFKLPVGIQKPVVAPTLNEDEQNFSRGKTYSYGIETLSENTENRPILRKFSYGIQETIPQTSSSSKSNQEQLRLRPYAVRIEEVSTPQESSSSCLFGEHPIGIERPIQSSKDSIDASVRSVKLMSGLRSRIDRMLVPIDCVYPDGAPEPCVDP